METMHFEQIRFEDNEDTIKGIFLDRFWFSIPKDKLGECKVEDGDVKVKSVKKFNHFLDIGLENMQSSVTRKPATYIYKERDVPLIGTNYFGLIDRGTNIIEIKPITGCNENCVYCSVDEGPATRKNRDFIVEKDYLVEEFRKLAKFKDCEIDAHINAQGEPTLYKQMPELIRDIASTPNVGMISIDTNASLLSEEDIDAMVDAGLKRFNLSFNAIGVKKAKVMAGLGSYDIETIKERARFMATKCKVLLAPVYVQGYNDEEIVPIVKFAQEIGADVGIQNFLSYKKGRNPAKEKSWEDFEKLLDAWEKETGAKLKVSAGDYNIFPAKSYPKPFRKGQTIDAEIKLPGRYPREKLAVAGGRIITIPNCDKEGNVRVKITRSKHNIFYGEIR